MYMNLIGLAIAMAKEGCQGICRCGYFREPEHFRFQQIESHRDLVIVYPFVTLESVP